MSTRRGWVHPEVYREARRAGYRPDRRTWLGTLADDRFLAETARELADEILAGRAREVGRLWA